MGCHARPAPRRSPVLPPRPEAGHAAPPGGPRGRHSVGCRGGRWDSEALDVLRELARAKSRVAPDLLRLTAALAWHRRWMCMLSVAAQTALAGALLAPCSPHLSEMDGEVPDLGDVLAGGRDIEGPSFSRLPLR